MQRRFIPALLTLLSGAIVSIINIYYKIDTLTSLKRLLITIVVFYILGVIIKNVVVKVLDKKPQDKDKQSENNENKEDNDSDSDPNQNNTNNAEPSGKNKVK